MNQKLFFFSLLALFFLYAFYEGDKNPKEHNVKKTSEVQKAKISPGEATIAHTPFSPISPDSLANMLSCYGNHPLFKTPGSDSSTRFFVLDSVDWQSIITLNQKKPIKALYFKFGIKNYDQVNKSGAAPIYTIITMPVDKATGLANTAQAFDFACPCPGAPCCPKE